MPSPKAPKPPADLGDAGSAIWSDITDNFDLTEAERTVLLSACRTADLVAALQARIDADGPVLDTGRSHPLLVEVRQQRIVLARLVAALRVPDDDDNRPQRRGGSHRG